MKRLMNLVLDVELPPEWVAWVEDNEARGCTSESILCVLHEHGMLDGPAQSAQALVARPDLLVEGRDGNTLVVDGHPVRIVCELAAPRVVVFENLLSEAECDALIGLVEGKLQRATVVDDAGGGFLEHEHRTSDNAEFALGEHAVVAAIEARLAALLGWPVENGEGLQVLRYGEGGEYRAHYDYFDATPGGLQQMEVGGQRVGTCVMYLSEVEAGGGTRFPSIGFEVRPRKGGAVFFADIDAFGAPDELTLHAGVPVVRGDKYVATKWLRERRYGA